MPKIIQHLYEKIFNQLINLKTDKDKDQNIINNLLEKIGSLNYDVYMNNIIMEFLYNIEVIKQYRISVMNSEKIDFSVL